MLLRGLRRFDPEIESLGNARSHLRVGCWGFAIEHRVTNEVAVMLEGFHRISQGYGKVQLDELGDFLLHLCKASCVYERSAATAAENQRSGSP